MSLFGRVIIVRMEATSKKNLGIKIESLKKILDEGNEFNWGKCYIIKVEDMYEKE